MLSSYVANKLADALQSLALANWHEFVKSPALCRLYWTNLSERKHVYVPDRITCGLADCWSSYRALCERYRYPSPVFLDCEDAACAHAGWLAAQCYTDRVLVGIVPGRRISHAICGIERDGKKIVIDTARWFGMEPTHYENPVWRYVDRKDL
jgi:hypothetical protein